MNKKYHAHLRTITTSSRTSFCLSLIPKWNASQINRHFETLSQGGQKIPRPCRRAEEKEYWETLFWSLFGSWTLAWQFVTGYLSVLKDATRHYKAVSVVTSHCRVLQSSTRSYKMLQGTARCYKAVQPLQVFCAAITTILLCGSSQECNRLLNHPA